MKESGFTLMELLVGIVIAGILTLIAIPAYTEWMSSSRYKQVAMEIGSALREGKTLAVSGNLQSRIEFDIEATPPRYRILQGNRAANSDWTTATTVTIRDWVLLPAEIRLRAAEDCDVSTGLQQIGFNPNGTASAENYICTMDNGSPPVAKFRTGVAFPATGRITLVKR